MRRLRVTRCPVRAAIVLALLAVVSRGQDAGVWLFEEGAGLVTHDAGGDADLTLTLYGGPAWTNDSPAGGTYALQFDGTTDYARPILAGSNKLNFRADECFSIEAWIKWNGGGEAYQYIAGNRWSAGYALFVHRDNAVPMFILTGDTDAVAAVAVTRVDDGTWHHVRGTYDPVGGISIHVDENIGAADRGLTGHVTYNGYFTVGARNLGTEYFFAGAIAEVRAVRHPCQGIFRTALWPFDEGSGNEAFAAGGDSDMTLTLYGVPAWTNNTPAAYSGNRALDFDGVDDYALTGVAGTMQLEFDAGDAFSVESWIKWDGGGDPYHYIAGNRWAAGYALFVYRDGGVPAFIFTGDADEVAAAAVTRVDDGAWHHVRGTYDPQDGIAVYVDGQQEDRTHGLTGLVSYTEHFAVGARTRGTENFFRGTIDDVKVTHNPLRGIVNAEATSGYDLIVWDGRVQKHGADGQETFEARVVNTSADTLDIEAEITLMASTGTAWYASEIVACTPGTTTVAMAYGLDDHGEHKLHFILASADDAGAIYHSSWYLVKGSYALQGEETDRGYVSFSTASPFERILPYTVPDPANVTTTLWARAVPGEYEPVAFSIYNKTNDPLRACAVTLSDLVATGGSVIASSNVDVRVVKAWYQAGAVSLPGEKPIAFATTWLRDELVPELLLKDDSLVDAGLTNVLNFTGVPDDADTLQPVTIPIDATRQFWLSVHVPAGAEPGDYTGTITVTPDNAPSLAMGLALEVPAIEWVEPRQDRGIYYRHLADDAGNPESVSRSLFQAHLRDMKEHGLTTSTIYDHRLASIQDALNDFVGQGMRDPFVVMNRSNVSALLDYVQLAFPASVPELAFYVYDEPNSTSLIEIARQQCEDVQAEGGNTITGIAKAFADLLGPLLDIPNYSLARAYDYISSLADSTGVKNTKREWYYRSIGWEQPNENRLLFGLYLEKSKLDGCCLYAYQHVFGASAFDDRDHAVYRDIMLVYPEQDTWIPTVQWEACCEGVDDLRYVSTLKELIRRGEASQRTEAILLSALAAAKTELDDVLNSVSMRIPPASLSSAALADARSRLIDRIVDLQAVLDVLGIGPGAHPASTTIMITDSGVRAKRGESTIAAVHP